MERPQTPHRRIHRAQNTSLLMSDPVNVDNRIEDYPWRLPYSVPPDALSIKRRQLLRSSNSNLQITKYYWRVEHTNGRVSLIHESKRYYDTYIPPF